MLSRQPAHLRPLLHFGTQQFFPILRQWHQYCLPVKSRPMPIGPAGAQAWAPSVSSDIFFRKNKKNDYLIT